MPKRIIFVEAEINRRLGAAVAADSPNGITAGEVREWAREYLARMDKEFGRSPEEATFAHSNLWMRDVQDADALFVVLIFYAERLVFFCGTGESFDVISYFETEAPDPDDEYEDMAQQFQIPQPPLHIDRRAAALWLGRGWKP